MHKGNKEMVMQLKLTNSVNMKESWQTINQLLHRKSMIKEINVNRRKIVGDKNTPNEFNKYFSEIGKKLANEMSHNYIDPIDFVNLVSNSFTFKRRSKEDLYHTISCMRTNRSVRLIQGAGSTILYCLHYIFNLS